MSSDTQRPLMNGYESKAQAAMDGLNAELKKAQYIANFHGDESLADKQNVMTGAWADVRDVLTLENARDIGKVGWRMLRGKGLDVRILPVVT